MAGEGVVAGFAQVEGGPACANWQDQQGLDMRRRPPTTHAGNGYRHWAWSLHYASVIGFAQGGDALMEIAPIAAKPRNPVRWPFRILAALIVLAGVVVLAGTGIAVWTREQPSLQWQLLASMPGMLWFVRLGWHAAIRGKSPATEHWPFASQRVLTCYMIVLMLMLFHPFGG
jgi:hypothetical protein